MKFLSEEGLRREMLTSLGGKSLYLGGQSLHELPAALFELTELQELYLSLNKLTTIPENLGKLNNLTILDVRRNQLSIFPTSLTQLKKLRWLSISHNNLTIIPDAIWEMVELERLGLSGNQLTVLSPAIKQLKKLKYLDVRGNPFTVEGMRSVMELKDKIHRVYSDVPDHVDRQRAQGPVAQLAYEEALKDGYVQVYRGHVILVGQDGAEIMSEKIADGHRAQLAYERALKDGYVKVYRGRIMLIGQDRAGKTSLKKSLLGLPFDPKEQSTEGIEVDPSKCEIDVDQVRNWQSTNEKKPGLLECAKDVAEIVAEKLVVLRRNFEDISGEEDSEDGSVQEDFSECNTTKMPSMCCSFRIYHFLPSDWLNYSCG